MVALIVDLKDGVAAAEISTLGNALQGGESSLRLFPEQPLATRGAVAAVVRVPGFLPEDRYDLQPLWSLDRKTLFVCQVRLDNRSELLAALEMGNLCAAEIADSTILHAAYQRWGERCVEHLTGDYAFAAYSMDTQRVFAAVDHLSHYRLYYATQGRRILLSTQLAALSKQQDTLRDVDVTAVGLCAEARYLPGMTPFRNIRQLPGGDCLCWDSGALETRRWWQPETRSLTSFRNPLDYVEAAREVFERAVLSCLRSATPVRSTLSGGLDSGLVTSIAATLLRKQGASLTAYTSAPAIGNAVLQRRGWDADDSIFAAQTAAFHPNIQHVILRSSGRVALDLLPRIHQRCATPVRNGGNHVWLDDIAQHSGPGVLLTGARGNFSISFTGVGGFAELLHQWRWRAAWVCASQAQRAEGKPLWKTLASGLFPRRMFESLRSRLYGERMEFLSLTAESFRAQHRATLDPQRPAPGTRAAFARKAMLSNFVWAADPLPLWGLEWRDPTGDRRLLELVLSFPLAAFAFGGRNRGLARQVGRDLLPDAIRLRKTQGLQSADYATAMAHHMHRYKSAQELMNASAICQDLFALSALRAAMQRVADGELSGAVTFPIDRCVDTGLFLMEQDAR